MNAVSEWTERSDGEWCRVALSSGRLVALVRPLDVPRPPWAKEPREVVPPMLWQWWVPEEDVRGLASSPELARQRADAHLARPQ